MYICWCFVVHVYLVVFTHFSLWVWFFSMDPFYKYITRWIHGFLVHVYIPVWLSQCILSVCYQIRVYLPKCIDTYPANSMLYWDIREHIYVANVSVQCISYYYEMEPCRILTDAANFKLLWYFILYFKIITTYQDKMFNLVYCTDKYNIIHIHLCYIISTYKIPSNLKSILILTTLSVFTGFYAYK